jgi:phosphatidylserine/phosphatidylglycerophosphate/cardiolipin synthase-like enzyme
MRSAWLGLAALGLIACAVDVGESEEEFLTEGTLEAKAVLALVNDPEVDVKELDVDAALDSRAAKNIVAHRDGKDGAPKTADDDPFDTVRELDDVKYVSASTLKQLLAYAKKKGYFGNANATVVFSPQAYAQSHAAKIVEQIKGAKKSIDVAMYSFSDSAVREALAAAVARGVKVRFVFETASEDMGATGAELAATKSAQLEKLGINVRSVSKIMHHKMAIIDGPRDDLAAANTATLITGSGNWSMGAATKYDENTLFLVGERELNLRMQREFNLLWEHSRDFVFDANLPYELSTAKIDDAAITDDPNVHAFFTSDNFKVNATTFSKLADHDTVANAWVAAIERANKSILIASGHLRSRKVAEALLKKKKDRPDVDIRVYTDGQEYISASSHAEQVSEREACLAAAGTSTAKQRDCYDKGFYYGYALGQAGVNVRYKYYAYRWDASYAKQMHHKYMLIDGDETWTGSYNLSDNAEHNTIENMLLLKGATYAKLAEAYRANFESMWKTARDDGSYQKLMVQVATAADIPLVFEPLALTWKEVADLKSAILKNCPAVNSQPYREEPTKHLTCPR